MSGNQRPEGWAKRLALTLTLLAGAAAGCIRDSSDRCGDHRRDEAAIEACVCADGAIAVDGGGVVCAEGAVVALGERACSGGERKGAGGGCVACPAAGCSSLR